MHGGPQLSRLKKKPHNKKNKTFSLCRAVFSFCREVFSFAVRFFLLPWGFFFRHEVFSFATRLFLLPRGNYLCSDSWGPLYKCEAKRSVRSWGKNKRKFTKKKSTSLSTKPYTYIDSFAWHRPREVAETIFQGVTTHLQGSSKLICSCVQN